VLILTSNLATDKITNMAIAAWEEGKEPDVAEIAAEVKPALVAHFKPALLARMTSIVYLPLPQSALGKITRLKLDSLVDRLKKSQRIEATYTDEMVESIASRCKEVDTGARNIDHILRATLLPQLSSAILERMAESSLPKKVQIGVDPQHNFTVTFSD
jgi:type VI secretion system protein VasG